MQLDLDYGLAVLLLQIHPHIPRIVSPLLAYLRAFVLEKPLSELPKPTEFLKPDNFNHYHVIGNYFKVKHIALQKPKKKLTTASMHGQWSNKTSETDKLHITFGDRQLQIDHSGELVPLEHRGEDNFFANHPDFDRFLFKFCNNETKGINLSAGEISHGGDWYATENQHSTSEMAVPADWSVYFGHFRSHNPWLTNFRVVIRKDELIMIFPKGTEQHLTPIHEGIFRIGEVDSPERLYFN